MLYCSTHSRWKSADSLGPGVLDLVEMFVIWLPLPKADGLFSWHEDSLLWRPIVMPVKQNCCYWKYKSKWNIKLSAELFSSCKRTMASTWPESRDKNIVKGKDGKLHLRLWSPMNQFLKLDVWIIFIDTNHQNECVYFLTLLAKR